MTRINIDTEFLIGDIVYLKTDPEQLKRIIVAIKVYEYSRLSYIVALGSKDESENYAIELSKDINMCLKLNITDKNND